MNKRESHRDVKNFIMNLNRKKKKNNNERDYKKRYMYYTLHVS